MDFRDLAKVPHKHFYSKHLVISGAGLAYGFARIRSVPLSQIAGTVTQGNLTAAMVQLMAFEAAKEAAETYETEITRREALADRVATKQQSNLLYDAHIAGIIARRETLRAGMLFPIPGH